MTESLSRLQRAVLVQGSDDWVPLLAMDGLIRLADQTLPTASRAHLLVAALTDLVERELVELGTVTREHGFVPFAAPAPRQRIATAYAGDETQGWGFDVWSRNTVAGPVTMLALTVDTMCRPLDRPDGPLDGVPVVGARSGAEQGELLVWLTDGRLSALELAWWGTTP